MGLTVFAVVKLCKYHQQENMRVSMAKERKRLINEDVVNEVQTGKPGRDNPAQVHIFRSSPIMQHTHTYIETFVNALQLFVV